MGDLHTSHARKTRSFTVPRKARAAGPALVPLHRCILHVIAASAASATTAASIIASSLGSSERFPRDETLGVSAWLLGRRVWDLVQSFSSYLLALVSPARTECSRVRVTRKLRRGILIYGTYGALSRPRGASTQEVVQRGATISQATLKLADKSIW